MRVTYTPSILLFLLIQSSMLSTARAPPNFNPYALTKRQPECVTDSKGNTRCGYPKVRPCLRYRKCRQDSGSSILQNQSSMRYGTNLTSEEGSFTVGFFVLGNNTYLGTWYGNFSNEPVIVWVANRGNPIPSPLRHNCSLVLGNDGKVAIVLDSHINPYWSTYPSSRSDIYLQILDNGNLVLVDGDSLAYLWQSFEHPTDTFLVGIKFDNSVNLTSWKSPEDPSEGDYVFKWGEGDRSNDLSMYISSQSSTPYWDSSLSGGLPPNLISLLYNNLTGNSTLRLVMNSTGSVQLWELDQDGESWSMTWAAPKDQCDLYDPCGSFGVCDAGNGFRCKCLPGYQPSDPVKWESKDFSSGCSKKTNDPCGDMFLSLPMIKLPPNRYSDQYYFKNEAECKAECVRDCSKAYSFDHSQSKCRIWTDGLRNIEEEYYNADANTLNIRLNHLDLDLGSRTCSICGTNVLPYPLSSNSSCGDPNYHNFKCNMTNGQVYFKPPSGRAYKISHIDPIHRKFTLQLVSANRCVSIDTIESEEFNLNNTSSFKVTRCSIITLLERPSVAEVEVSWTNPPYPPACNSTADCKDWIETNCGLDKDYGKKVCLCAKGFRWDSLSMNCTKGHHKQHTSFWIKVGIASGLVLFLLCGIALLVHFQRRATNTTGTGAQFKADDIEEIDIPFVDYQSIVAATDNFSDANKLGAGGFGPVYKGILADGNEVAVKRLSAASVQGIQEFRNEIILIAKLQHRNLVRVVGYCISEDEKILLYEYMPKKSLDASLFDQAVSPSLDWTKRVNIILGIARGLMYLHEDSRLRIIHRDLKPSNILLDEDLNPKISDFGLAKIIAGNDMATNTARIVGTYGYMSPEYALEGYFSIKSDVYSFGIIIFEVISGRRSTSLLPLENSLTSLLGYAWDLWKQGKELELVDKSIIDTCDSLEVKRFINVALLCVQENPSDRPTMSSALLMLSSDNMNLPYPKQPVFVARSQPFAATSSSKFGSSTDSKGELTTTLEGR